MTNLSLQQRRDLALGSGTELFYDEPLEIVRGEGVYLYDKQGRRYVDMYNNVPSVGHANPAVVRAMAEQQATLNTHSRYLHEGIVAYAERLVALNHEGIQSAVFSCSGTEGIEVAIQIARLVTGNRGLLCTDATYHGNTELVASMSYLGCPHNQSGEIRSFPFPERYRPLLEGVSEQELSDACLARVESAIDSLEREGHGVAALLVCSIFANEGVPDIPAGFMPRVTELVHSRGGLVVADEVQSGYGRTGCWWGYEKVGFRPDLVVGGKPMGNGLPLGATLASREHIGAFRAEKDYFNTCAASPLQAAVGMAVLDEIERLDLVRHSGEVGDRLTRKLRDRMDRFEAIGDVRGSGLFISVEMVSDRKDRTPDRASTLTLGDRLKDKGFLVSYSGKFENVLKIRPPLVFSHANADDFLVAFDECMKVMYG